MSKLKKDEIEFVKRAHAKCQVEGKNIGTLDLENEAYVLELLRSWRAWGFMTPRRADHGADGDMWRQVVNKVGGKLETPEETRKRHAADRSLGLLTRTIEAHDEQIEDLKRELKLAQTAKVDATHAIERTLQKEIDDIEKKKQEAVEKLKSAQSARQRLEAAREHEELLKEKKNLLEEKIVDGNRQRKCWKCGEWFLVSGGVYTKHAKECTGE